MSDRPLLFHASQFSEQTTKNVLAWLEGLLAARNAPMVCDCQPLFGTDHKAGCIVFPWQNAKYDAGRKLENLTPQLARNLIAAVRALEGRHSHVDMTPDKHPLCDCCVALKQFQELRP